MFDPDRLYLTNDPALRALGKFSTLAHWRCEGRGPSYIKVGSRVAYSGKDLNAWLATQRIDPTDRADTDGRTCSATGA